MSEQKGLPEEISEKYKSERHGSDERKFESIQKDLGHDGNKSKTYQSRSKQQKDDHLKDGLSTKDLQAILVACRDTKLPIKDIVRGLGLSKKIESDVLKIIDRCRKKDSNNREIREFSWTGNISGEIQTSGNNIFVSGRYNSNDNNYADIRDTLSIIHTAFDNVIASDCSTMHASKDPFLRAQRENSLQELLFFGSFLVASDGDGDSDPERTKLTVDSKPLGLPAASLRYLMELKTKNEIHIEVLTKEETLVDISKTIKPSIDKLSWNEKCEENNVDIYASEEEEGNEGLASACPHYCGGEIDDMVDQSVTCGLDDYGDVQQFNDAQAAEAEENQDDKDEDSVANDPSSETQENGGGGMLLEDTDVSVQIRLTSEGVIVEEKSAVHIGNQELAGAGQTTPIDYVLQCSQLVGKQPHQTMYTWSETAGIKHYLLANESSITVTTNEVFANLAVDNTLQESLPTTQEQPHDNLLLHGDSGSNSEGEYNAVEQAPETPLIYLSFEQTVLLLTTMEYHSVLQFPQPEDQSTPLSNQVDTLTEDIPEAPYFDAVEAQPDEDSEEIENYPQLSFVSSPAENVENESEEIHIEQRRRSRRSNCCLL